MGLCATKYTSTVRLDGKTALITGSNTGIGKMTVKNFFERGCRVIMACRNVEKANEAADDIRKLCEEKENLGEILVTQLDLTSLQSVRKCAKHVLDTEKRLDILVNNAGVMLCPEGKTADGFEIQFGTNHLGHFLLTLLLLPKIINSAPSRIVTLSSSAHAGRFEFDDINFEKKEYDSIAAYGQSKLANILFTKELARRLQAANIRNVTTYSLHPGVIASDLGRHLGETYNCCVKWTWEHILSSFVKTPEEGAQTTIYCSVDEKCANETGLYYSDCKIKAPREIANNEDIAKKLWEVSWKMVDLDENYDPFKKE